MNGPASTRTSPLASTSGGPCGGGPGSPASASGLGHRLAMLELVLRHHPDEEVVPRKLREPLEDLFAYVSDVGARLLR